MKRKLFYGIMITVMLFTLCACGAEEEKKTSNKKEEAFTFVYENLKINLGDVFTTEKYGEELEYVETPSCAFEGLDKTYRYDHYEINTYPDKEEDKIISIYFLDEEVATTEGISIGDDKEKMIEIYGDDYNNQDSLYTYTKGKTELQFMLQDDTIISIEYLFDAE